MEKQTAVTKKEIVTRIEKLETARKTLKSEFIGIDTVIDRLVDGIRTWFTLPELQERPTVINLWGMTGSGKTSLVKRLTQLLALDNSYYPIDMGNSNDDGGGFYNTLESVFEHNNGRPFIMLFDEFQHARTIKKEDERMVGRMGNFWKMLDTGKIEMHGFTSAIIRISDRAKVLKHALIRGIKVKGGLVIDDVELFATITDENLERRRYNAVRNKKTGGFEPVTQKGNKKPQTPCLPFVPEYDLDDIMELQPGRFHAEYEVANHLKTLSGNQIVSFLKQILEDAKKPKELDCSKSVVIIAGNLDEAYSMADDMNPDIPAEVWKALVKDISLNDIKEALRKRFRSEHIARLGNNHIVYPAIGEREFKQYITHAVQKICQSFKDKYGVGLNASQSLLKLIYKEGVYPTQGYRPVNTTIDQVLRSNLSVLIGNVLVTYPTTDSINLSYRRGKLVANYLKQSEVLGTSSISTALNLHSKRKLAFDDEQALTSVHEAGHVVCSALLLNDIPDVAVSATSVSNMGGFVIRTKKESLTQKDRLIRLSAYALGGYVAEKLIYGDDNVTNGSSSDIGNATSRIRETLSVCGFEIGPAFFETPNSLMPIGVLDRSGDLDRIVLEYMQAAESMAAELLKSEQELLLRMANALFKKGSLRKKEMALIVDQYANLRPEQRKPEFPFKSILEEKLGSINGLQKVA